MGADGRQVKMQPDPKGIDYGPSVDRSLKNRDSTFAYFCNIRHYNHYNLPEMEAPKVFYNACCSLLYSVHFGSVVASPWPRRQGRMAHKARARARWEAVVAMGPVKWLNLGHKLP